MKLNSKRLGGLSRIKEKEILDDKINYPIFCFKYIHKSYHINSCENEDKIRFLERIITLSGMTWQELEYSPKHGMGTEKIQRSAIKQDLPKEITDDVTHFLAFRFSGKKPFVGFRERFIFHILYIDRDFTLYNH